MINSTKNKSLIFLKAGTIALGIIFLVLLSALIILKMNKNKLKTYSSTCQKKQEIVISNNIENITHHNGNFLVLTKVNKSKNSQELIKIDDKCLNVISRIKFKIQK